MAQRARAIYEQGHLRLLDEVTMAEGQEVYVTFLSDAVIALPDEEIAHLVLHTIQIESPHHPGDAETHNEVRYETLRWQTRASPVCESGLCGA